MLWIKIQKSKDNETYHMCWCAQLLEGSKAMWALCASPNQWKPHLNPNIIRTKRAWLQRSLKPENPSTSSNPQSPSAAPPPFMQPPQLNRSFISLDADLTPSPPLATCSHLHLPNWILDQHPAPPSCGPPFLHCHYQTLHSRPRWPSGLEVKMV